MVPAVFFSAFPSRFGCPPEADEARPSPASRRSACKSAPDDATIRSTPMQQGAANRARGNANEVKERRMKEGYRFVDCDMHIMEPTDLFDKYLDPAFKSRITSAMRPTDGGATGMRRRPLWFFDGTPTSNDGNISQYNRTRGPLVSGRANKNVMFVVARGSHPAAQAQR